MQIFSADTSIRLNGNYGTTPDMASIWCAGTGKQVAAYTNDYSLDINFSSSIPATYVGLEIWTRMTDSYSYCGFCNRWSMISALMGYGVNAGGTSLSANNQNYDWYTSNGENNAGNAIWQSFDGTNRRLRLGIQCFDAAGTHMLYVRVVCRYISYVTISWA